MSGHRLCAITGSNGYVGRCIKDHLRSKGWEILELTRRPDSNSRSVQFLLGADVPPPALAEADALVHCAYDFAAVSWNDISARNVAGTQKLLQAARAAGVRKIVVISSISAYPGCRSLYGRAKLEIENLALAQGGLVVRPGLVYGDHPGGMFGKLTGLVRRSFVIPMIGGGARMRLVHHEDLSGFIASCVRGETETAPAVLTAAHEHSWPFRQLILEMARGLGKKVVCFPVPWRLVWCGLKAAEQCGLKPGFRSDSLVSLMHQNPNPDLSRNASVGLVCRPLQIEQLQL